MATNATLPLGVINPTTPLAYLPAELAEQFEASRYLYIAALSAWIWDVILSLPEEYTIIFKRTFSLPTFIYIVGRIGTIAFLLTSTIFQVGAVGNCQSLQVALAVCYCVAIPATSLLFFLRLRAIFDGRWIVIGFFAFMWVALLGGTLLIPFAIQGAHIGPTNRCINSGVKPYSSASMIINTINDTFIFVAISWRLLTMNHLADTWTSRVRAFVRGESTSALSGAMLQDGQMYYLATVGLNILTTVMILTPSVPPVYHAMFTIPNAALENAMASRVFRKLKLGSIKAMGSVSTVPASSAVPPMSFRTNRTQTTFDQEASVHPLDTFRQYPVQVAITRETLGTESDFKAAW